MKKPFWLACVSLWMLSCSTPQIQLANLPDYPEDALTKHYTIHNDVSYGPDTLQVMDIYLSDDIQRLGDKNYTLIFVHGGGFYLSDKKKEERYIRPYLQKGLNVINLNYRLKIGAFSATEDLATALRFLSDQKDKYALNLYNIVLTGFSAGGMIVSNIGCWYNEQNSPFDLPTDIGISAIICFSSPSHNLQLVEDTFVNWDDPFFVEVGKAFFPEHETYTREEVLAFQEPLNQFDADDPAYFLWYGGADNQVLPATHTKMLPLLASDPSKNRVIYVEKGLHSPSKEELRDAYVEIWKFLDAFTKRSGPSS